MFKQRKRNTQFTRRPQELAGMRIDPPPSLAWAYGTTRQRPPPWRRRSNRICQHAGIPRPTFYRRWPSATASLVQAFNDRFEEPSNAKNKSDRLGV